MKQEYKTLEYQANINNYHSIEQCGTKTRCVQHTLTVRYNTTLQGYYNEGGTAGGGRTSAVVETPYALIPNSIAVKKAPNR